MGSIDRGAWPVLGRPLPVRPAIRSMLLVLALGTLAPHCAPALARDRAEAAQPFGSALRGEIARRAGSDIAPFYAARGNRPLWLSGDGRPTLATEALLKLFDTAEADGVKPSKLKLRAIQKALDGARSGDPMQAARAELALSKSFTTYVKAMRELRRGGMIYESRALAPAAPTPVSALQAAANARALKTYVETLGWMHPLYAPTRAALGGPRLDPVRRRQILANLSRLRALPANPASRYVLIDAAGARLWMYENGRPVDSMKVVVGKPDQQTPMMAGFLRYAIVNPYWNVPVDLVRDRIAHNVLDKGLGYLANGGYQVLSDWTDRATVVDPRRVDWRKVASGDRELRVRQLPGGDNFMGKAKFMFPNAQGIYLHDTPDKGLMAKDARQFSSGCVRLEDASRFGRWLLKRPLPRSSSPEQHVALTELVPVYITYLTVLPEKGRLAFRDDVYGRDDPRGRKDRDARLADARP